MLFNYITGTREVDTILDFGSIIRVGFRNTGSLFLTSSALRSYEVKPVVALSYSAVVCANDTCYLIPVFSGTILPPRFILEMEFSKIRANDARFFWAIGTESGSNMSALGFAFDGSRKYEIITGTFSSSNNTFANAGFTTTIDGGNYTKKEFEFRTNVVGTGSDELVFRCRDFYSAAPFGAVVKNDSIWKSQGGFSDLSKFMTGSNGQTLNRLYLGFSSEFASTTNDMRLEAIRIMKHYMDWE
jgi:hypothetical protein